MLQNSILSTGKKDLFIKSNRLNSGRIVSLPGLDNSVLQIEGDLGVDNIKASFKTILEIGDDIVILMKDFSIQAAIPVLLKLTAAQTYFETFKKALAEFKDGISATEAEEISRDLKINFDLENQPLEDAIERIIDLLPATYQTAINIVSLSLEWKNTVVELKGLLQKKEAA